MEISQDLKILQAVVSSMMKNDSLSGISFNTFSVETLNLGMPINGGKPEVDQIVPDINVVRQIDSLDNIRLPSPRNDELKDINGELRVAMKSIMERLPRPKFHHLVKLLLEVGIDEVGRNPELLGEYIDISQNRASTWLRKYII